jgi:hypothetical protein
MSRAQSGFGNQQAGVVVMAGSTGPAEVERKLAEIRAAHRALDDRIRQLIGDGAGDQLELQRLKKQKLALKDRIAVLERARVPDIIA